MQNSELRIQKYILHSAFRILHYIRASHHPLIIKPDGDKLSTSSGDTGVRDLRAAGVDAPTELAWLRRRSGSSSVANVSQPTPSAGSWTTAGEDDDDESRKELRENSACFFAPPWPCSCLTEEHSDTAGE